MLAYFPERRRSSRPARPAFGLSTMRALLALSLSASLCLAPASAQHAGYAADTLGGACSVPVSSSSCPHPCPLIDGVATCVPVLEECDDCNPERGPADGVCESSLVCDAELRECRGVGVGQQCEANGKVCDEGLVCNNGVCRDENLETAGFGEMCDTDGNSANSIIKQCVETDGNGNRVICTYKPDNRTRKGPRFCLRRLADGESCSVQNGACGEYDQLRFSICDEANTCRVGYDYTCNSDSDCDTAEGEACIPAIRATESEDRFGCFKYSQQRGQECQRTTPFGRGVQTRKCAEGFSCVNRNPGFRDMSGTCATRVKDRDQCDEAQSIACQGTFPVNGGSASSPCINGNLRTAVASSEGSVSCENRDDYSYIGVEIDVGHLLRATVSRPERVVRTESGTVDRFLRGERRPRL